MPEGPEVERMRMRIAPLIGETVTISVARSGAKFMTEQDAQPYQNNTVTDVQRVGKRLGIIFDNTRVIAVGAGMTGSWSVEQLGGDTLKHEMFAIGVPAKGTRYVFSDVRCYGFVKPAGMDWDKDLGIDFTSPLLKTEDIGETLRESYTKKNSRWLIKAALLDQSIIAGIGNVYASELLWHMKVHPETPASEFKHYHQLAVETSSMLNTAINGKGFASSYNQRPVPRGGYTIEVYGRTGEPCTRCGTLIENKTLAGRGTYWCPTCQPATP